MKQTSNKPASIIYLIVPESFWYRALEKKSGFLPIEMLTTGAVHCFRERTRVIDEANAIADRFNEPLWVLCLDEHRLPGVVNDEPAPDGHIDPFVYGLIPRSAVVDIVILKQDKKTGLYYWPLRKK